MRPILICNQPVELGLAVYRSLVDIAFIAPTRFTFKTVGPIDAIFLLLYLFEG